MCSVINFKIEQNYKEKNKDQANTFCIVINVPIM